MLRARPAKTPGRAPTSTRRCSETGETHKLNLTCTSIRDKMVYATYSTGFRPGGINRRGTHPALPARLADNYEVGWKTTWFDNNFRWNGALFHEDWNNFQFSVLGLNSFTEIHNAGQAVINGIESDVDWLVDDHLSLAASGTCSTPI